MIYIIYNPIKNSYLYSDRGNKNNNNMKSYYPLIWIECYDRIPTHRQALRQQLYFCNYDTLYDIVKLDNLPNIDSAMVIQVLKESSDSIMELDHVNSFLLKGIV